MHFYFAQALVCSAWDKSLLNDFGITNCLARNIILTSTSEASNFKYTSFNLFKGRTRLKY